jgi:hypothetical protein
MKPDERCILHPQKPINRDFQASLKHKEEEKRKHFSKVKENAFTG